MDGLIEIVFESISIENANAFLPGFILKTENIISASIIGESDQNVNVTTLPQFIRATIESRGDCIIMLNIYNASICNRIVENASIQIISYSKNLDLVLIFSTIDLRSSGIKYSNEIFKWAISINQTLNAKKIFGGLEPAQDKETQIFSNAHVGPIMEI
ncbi:hypothetical protein V8J88_23855 [Massilia sp. W12]|uniref:hypothetical protein n=1 Tax=Massilia sp. W12 TaxID=3126507 RepID=UPI0030CFD0A7